jgi:MoaA/NifB/PqqE/SkfB family radical SAM enzyme
MECKFIKHGIALSYDQIVKPCCAWETSDSWSENNHYQKIDFTTWHQSPQVVSVRRAIESDQWPRACNGCERIEAQGRVDSMRGNGNHAYADYDHDDITLEIRPGNTCNFACQTCWPEASSRVAQYHNQAGLIDIKNLNSTRMDDFDFLLPIADRIQDVVLLGGEPFYDKSCLRFLSWAKQNLRSHLMMFTNGSVIDQDFLHTYPGQLTVIFSLDAVGKPAEYIRYGTIWSEVLENYLAVKSMANIEVRVNITCSVYNYMHLEPLIELLCADWPAVVSFGVPHQPYLTEQSIPDHMRDTVMQSLQRVVDRLNTATIPTDQRSNAVNAVNSIIRNLDSVPFDAGQNQQFREFMAQMDRVKQIRAGDYCDFLGRLQQEAA